MKIEGAAYHQPLILTYHSISAGSSPLCIPPEIFAEQMEWLAREGGCVVPLAKMVDLLARKQPFPPKTVALTFDDAFRDFYQEALPVLRRWRLPATVFVVTTRAGDTNRWPGQPAWCEQLPLMNWEEIKQVAGEGIDVGCHSRTHPALPELDEQALREEVLTGKKELEAQIGRPVESFCYPYGSWSPPVRALVRQHYRAACSTKMARISPDADPHSLPRIDVFYLRRPAVFQRLFSRSGSLYLGLRATLRELRSRIG